MDKRGIEPRTSPKRVLLRYFWDGKMLRENHTTRPFAQLLWCLASASPNRLMIAEGDTIAISLRGCFTYSIQHYAATQVFGVSRFINGQCYTLTADAYPIFLLSSVRAHIKSRIYDTILLARCQSQVVVWHTNYNLLASHRSILSRGNEGIGGVIKISLPSPS